MHLADVVLPPGFRFDDGDVAGGADRGVLSVWRVGVVYQWDFGMGMFDCVVQDHLDITTIDVVFVVPDPREHIPFRYARPRYYGRGSAVLTP